MRSNPEIVNWENALDSAFGHEETIDIWKIPLVKTETQIQILSDDEKDRLGKIQSQLARSVFYSSRIYLKHILSRYSSLVPHQLVFEKQASGKPYIKNSPIEFNLTHSDQLILLAVSKTHAVGIDVEKNRPIKNWQRIAEKVFSEKQLNELKVSTKQELLFSDLWTQFEAMQKMAGKGVFGDKPNDDLIRIYRFKPEKNYQGCLAFEETTNQTDIRFFNAGSLDLSGS